MSTDKRQRSKDNQQLLQLLQLLTHQLITHQQLLEINTTGHNSCRIAWLV